MKEETSVNVWKEWFLIEIRLLTRNDDLRKVTPLEARAFGASSTYIVSGSSASLAMALHLG